MFGRKKKIEEIVTYGEDGKVIETPKDILKDLGPIPMPPPKEEQPKDINVYETVKLLNEYFKVVLRTAITELEIKEQPKQQPTPQPVTTIPPPKNKGGRPKKVKV